MIERIEDDKNCYKMAHIVIFSPVSKIGFSLISLLSTGKDRTDIGTYLAIYMSALIFKP